MSNFTELVAAVVVHSSAAAYAHFGVTLEPVLPDVPSAAERTVSRTPINKPEDPPTCATPRSRALKT